MFAMEGVRFAQIMVAPGGLASRGGRPLWVEAPQRFLMERYPPEGMQMYSLAPSANEYAILPRPFGLDEVSFNLSALHRTFGGTLHTHIPSSWASQSDPISTPPQPHAPTHLFFCQEIRLFQICEYSGFASNHIRWFFSASENGPIVG